MLPWIDKLLPDDDKPASLRRWRLRLACVACLSFAFSYMFVVPALFTGVPFIGQLAWADKVDEQVDQKVAAAIAPIQEQVKRIEATVAAQAADTSDVIVGLLASEIRAAKAALCAAPPGQRERENRRIEELQRKYKARIGGEYDVPNCNEL